MRRQHKYVLIILLIFLQKDTNRVLWFWGSGILDGPHHPTMLDNGHVLIFDNGTRRKYSKVIELDPGNQRLRADRLAGRATWTLLIDITPFSV